MAFALHSSQASRVDARRGAYTFHLGGVYKAKTITLASFEFPASQPTVCAGRNVLHARRGGICLTPEETVFRVERLEAPHAPPLTVRLPPHRMECNISAALVTTQHPHGLFTVEGAWTGSTAFLVCDTPGGRLDLTPETCVPRDANTFQLVGAGIRAGPAVMCTQAFASAHEVCDELTCQLSRYAHLASHGGAYTVVYDAQTDSCTVRAGNRRIRCSGGLAARLGLDGGAGTNDVRGNVVGGWTHSGELSVGWYVGGGGGGGVGGAGRGAPSRALEDEVEALLNRFAFESDARLVFRDATGARCVATLAAGRYAAPGLAAALTRALTKSLSRAFVHLGGAIEVREHACGFAIGCAWDFETLAPTLTLEFAHPQCTLEAWRLGFERRTYSYAASYRSDAPLPLPVGSCASYVRCRSTGRRLVFDVDPSAPLRGVCEPTGEACTYSLRTLATEVEVPYASGVRVGDVLTLIPTPGAGKKARTSKSKSKKPAKAAEEGDGGEVSDEEDDLRHARPADVVQCVVRTVEGAELTVFAPRSVRGTRVRLVRAEAEPLSLSTVAADSVPGGVLGIDGALASDGTTPLEAPRVYTLDPPDYVTLRLEGVSAARDDFVHTCGASEPLRRVFTKVVLQPAVSREAAIPRTLELANAHLGELTIVVERPDGSAYDLHSAHFGATVVLTT